MGFRLPLTRSTRRAAMLPAAATLAALGLAACGSTSEQLPTDKIEEEIRLSTQPPFTSVICPDEVTTQTDEEFTCNATLEGGGQATIEVTLGDDGDTYTARIIQSDFQGTATTPQGGPPPASGGGQGGEPGGAEQQDQAPGATGQGQAPGGTGGQGGQAPGATGP